MIDTNMQPWITSPEPGIECLPLDRVGGERATSLVRYAAGSSFSAHQHGGGEEILVLTGIFSNEHGDYPAGTYVRTPVSLSHHSFSREGCTVFVKLRQFACDDMKPVLIDTSLATWSDVSTNGLSRLTLHRHGDEKVELVRFAPNARVPSDPHPGGEEVLVLEGVLSDEAGHYPAGVWVRDPPGSSHAPYSETGCVIYVKEGHLNCR